MAAAACHSDEAKREPSTQKVVTAASAPGTASSEPPLLGGVTWEDEVRRVAERTAFLEGKFEQDGPADSVGQAAETQLKARYSERSAKFLAAGVTVAQDSLACKATMCRAQVTFASESDRSNNRGIFGVPSGVFAGQYAMEEHLVGDASMKFFLALKGNDLPR